MGRGRPRKNPLADPEAPAVEPGAVPEQELPSEQPEVEQPKKKSKQVPRRYQKFQ